MTRIPLSSEVQTSQEKMPTSDARAIQPGRIVETIRGLVSALAVMVQVKVKVQVRLMTSTRMTSGMTSRTRTKTSLKAAAYWTK